MAMEVYSNLVVIILAITPSSVGGEYLDILHIRPSFFSQCLSTTEELNWPDSCYSSMIMDGLW